MSQTTTADLHGTARPRNLSGSRRSAAPPMDRVRPHSLEAEQGVLGCILLSPADSLPECIQAFRGCNEVFHDLRHRTLFESMRSLAEKGGAIDLITLSQHLRDRNELEEVGGVGYVSQLPDTVPSAANLDYYVDIVLEKHLLRRVLDASDEIATWVYQNPADVGQLLDRVERHILEINQDRVGVPENRMREIILKAQETIQDLFERQGELKGIPSGFRDLDRKYTNGFNGGEMIVVAARPSVGKTSFAMNIAEHVAVARGLPVGVFSLEMSAESLGLRLLCSRARVNLSNVRDGFLTEPDFRRLTIASGELAKAPLFIDDTGGITILELRAKARRMKQKYNGDMHCSPVTATGSVSVDERLSAHGAGIARPVLRRGGLSGVLGSVALARRIRLSALSRSRRLGDGAGPLPLPPLPVSSLGHCGNAVCGHESALAALV